MMFPFSSPRLVFVLVLLWLATPTLVAEGQTLTITPDPVTLSVRSGEVAATPLTLTNATNSPLGWRLEGLDANGRPSTLEGQLDAVLNSGTTLNGPLPLRYDFTGGETGTSLNGNPPNSTGILSQGNRLLTNLGGPLAYTDNLVSNSSVLGPTGRYFTRKMPGLFMFGAETDGIQWFEVAGSITYGNLKQNSTFRLFHKGRWWSAFVVNHVDYWKTINHLVLVDQAGLQQTLGSNSSQQQRITGLSGKRRIYQFLYITNSNMVQPQAVFEDLATRFLDLLPDFGTRMTFEPRHGTSPQLAAGSSTVSFDALGLDEGIHQGRVRATAATATELASAPVEVTVTAPRLEVPVSVERKLFPGQVPETVELPLTSNLPEAQSWTAAVISPVTWLTVESSSGTTPQPLRLRLDPAGLPVGRHTMTAEIRSGPATFHVPVTLQIRELAIRKFVADPRRPVVYAVNQNAKDAGEVLEISTVTQAITRSVRVGKEPSDLDLTENGLQLVVINTSGPSLSVVDLASFTVTETIPLTEFSNRNDDVGGHVKCGKGSVVYYVDEQWGPRLRVFDTATKTVLQTFSAQNGTSPNTENNYGYGDINLSSDRNSLFGWVQYGDGAGWAGTAVVRFTAGKDGRLSGFARSADYYQSSGNFLREPFDTPVLLSRDGSRLVIKGRVVDRNNLDFHPTNYPSEIYSLSPGGEIAVSSTTIYAGEGGELLHKLPVTSSIQTVLPDYSALVYFNTAAKSLGWLDLPRTLGTARLGLELAPADGSTVVQPSRLKWLPITGITRYQVYLGASRSEVENATTTSASYLGLSDANEMALKGGLTVGQTYYWRAVPVDSYGIPVGGGTVYSFHVSSMSFSRNAIAAETVQGVTSHLETITLESAVPQAWTATESIVWIKSVTASGATPGTLTVQIDATGLAAGLHEGTVNVMSAGSQVAVPVSLRVYAPNFVIADADLDLPYVYLISQADVSSTQPSFLLRLNTATDKIESAIQCGSGVTDLAIHYLENRIYLTNWKTGVLRAYDRTTFSQVQTYQFAPVGAIGYGEGGIWRISAGKAGRLIIEESDQWIDIRLINTATGAVMATQSNEYAGDGEADPLGRYYYHSEALGTSDSLTRYDLSADTFVRKEPSGNGSAGTVVMIPDGSRIAVGPKVFDPDLLLQFTLPANVLSATLHGDLLFTSNKAYNGVTGLELATLPVNTTVMSVSGDQKKLYQFPANSAAFRTVDLGTIAKLPSRALTPVLADGATRIGTSQELAWSIEPVALSYDVYFGTSAAAVASATQSSPQYLGNTPGSRWTGALPPLGLASDYFWRVDVVAFSGTAKGSVWSFRIAPLEIEPIRLSVVLPANAPAQTFDLQLSGPVGSTWTASESTSWLSLPANGGVVPSMQQVTINPAGLAVGTHTGSVRFQSGGDGWDLPVSLEVIALNYTHAAADLDRSRIYAISQPSTGTDDRAFLAVFDTATNEVVEVVPVGRSVTSLSIHYQENRLYLTNWASGVLRALDRDTLEEVRTYSFSPAGATGYGNGDAYGVAAGRSGRIMVEEQDQWVDSWLVDTATGNKLATINFRQGGGLFDPTGRYYFHGESNSSGAEIGKYDTLDDKKITEVASKRVEIYSYYGSRLVAMSGDGSRVFWNGGVFDADLNILMQLKEEVITSTYRGELIFTNTKAVNGSNSQTLATLPLDTKVQAVSGDQRKLFLFKNASVSVVDIANIANVPPPGLIPGIKDGSTVIGTSQELKWSQEAAALSYDVYFGTKSAVTDATKTSPAFLGNVTGTRWNVSLPELALGGQYYWRVDINGFSSVTKGTVWLFQIAPVDVMPRAVKLAAPAGSPVPTQSLAMTAGAATAWTASTTTPWITLRNTSGTTPGSLQYDINTTGLTIGIKNGSIKLLAEGQSFTVPVELSIVTLNVTKLITHPNRPVVYGINTTPAGEGFCHLLEINPATATIERTLPIGFAPTDADLDPVGERLYISNWGYSTTRVIDVAGWAELPPLNLGEDIYKLEVIPNGRLVTEGQDQWIQLNMWDAAGGRNLASSASPYFHVREGDGQADPTGNYYYRCDNNSSGAVVTKYDIRSNSFVSAVTGPQIGYGSRNLILSEDGSRLFWLGRVMDPDLTTIGQMPAEVHATNRTGDLAVGPAAVWWSDSAIEVAALPFSSTIAAFSKDDSYLLRYNAATRTLHSVRVSTLTDLPGPRPRPGQVIKESPARLSWTPVAGATSYRIFIAADAAALQALPSPTATVANAEYLPASPLGFGRFYSWRVDALTSSGVVTGKVNSFGIEFPAGPVLPQIGNGSTGIAASLSDRHLLVGTEGSAQLYHFDQASGVASPVQNFTLPGYYGDHNFGSAVAVDAGKAVIGAHTKNNAYVFRPDSTGYWESSGALSPPSPVSGEGFGRGLSASGNLMLAGTSGSSSTVGRVCAYVIEPGENLTQTFSANDAVANDGFGQTIAMEGNLAVISATGNGPSYTRVPSLYAFSRSTSSGLWTQTQKISIPGASTFDISGRVLALSGNTLATSSSSAVILYTRNASGQWIQSATINRATVPNSSSNFGRALAVVGGQLFIGDSGASHNGTSGGAVFSFRRSGTSWIAGPVIVATGSRSSFGGALTGRGHWLVAASGGSQPAWVFRVGATDNRPPLFQSRIPTQAVAGRAFSIQLHAEDADGNAGLVIEKLQGPAWLGLQDLGNGQATLSGTPSGKSGDVYQVQLRVRDAAGGQAHHTYLLSLLSPTDLPVLESSPVATHLGVGQELVLRASASGIGPFQWQWFKDGKVIDGATGSRFLIGEVGLENAGSYHVRVSNVVSSIESTAVEVSVRPADRYAGAWPTFGGSPAHSGRHPAALDMTHFLSAWNAEVQPDTVLNRAAIADGRAVVVPASRFASSISVRALDLKTGAPLWSFPVPSSNSTNPPSIHRDKVYFQRGKGTGGGDTPQLYSLNAANGQQLWASTFGAQWESYEAPAVSDAGIFINGGTYGGIYGFNLDGSQRFFQSLAQYDRWAPTLANGRLFSWVGSGTGATFTEHNPNDGATLWKINPGSGQSPYSMYTVSAVAGDTAAIITTTELIAVDLASRSIRWRVAAAHRGSPGIADGRVFAIQGNAVRSYGLADGTPGLVYQTSAGTGYNDSLVDQPILFNDRLAISNEAKTWIFNLEDGTLLQTLDAGGRLSYAMGYLLAAGNDGVVRAFIALNYNPKLASLEVDSGDFLPEFDSLTTRYITTVPFETAAVTLTPTTEYKDATVKINGVPEANGSASRSIALAVGENEIQTLVTAEDGITTLTYTLVVTRLPQNFVFDSAEDIPLTANGLMTGGFPVNVILNYHPVPGTALTMVNNTGSGFIHGRFGNLAHGQRITLQFGGVDYDFIANYHGGNGNDLVLHWADTAASAWGQNNQGQLGDGTTVDAASPVSVQLSEGVLTGKTIFAMSAGYLHSLALLHDGSVAAWGYNVQGQLGLGHQNSTHLAGLVDRNGALKGKTVIAIAAGALHNLALCDDGTIVSWGMNNHGQLGTGDRRMRVSPVIVEPLGSLVGKRVVAIAAGFYHSLALCEDGTVVGWGYNDEGELGDGTTTTALVPVAVDAGGALAGKSVARISAGQYHALALCTDGTLVAWGYNASGQLGDGTTTDRRSPVLVERSGVAAGTSVQSLSAGGSHSLAKWTDGSLVGWGENSRGQLISGGPTRFLTPQPLNGTALEIHGGAYHSVARRTPQLMDAWGDAKAAWTSNGAEDLLTSPPWVAVASGPAAFHNLAIVALPGRPRVQASVLALWRKQHFSAAGIEDGVGSCDDCDQDGIPNLVEYAFALDPLQNSNGKIPQPQRVGDRLELRFSSLTIPDDVICGAEWSPDLSPGSWREVPDSGSGDEHLFSLPLDTAPSVFMRIRVRSRE